MTLSVALSNDTSLSVFTVDGVPVQDGNTVNMKIETTNLTVVATPNYPNAMVDIVILNENKNGIYVNITELDDNILEDIYKFVEYIDKQEDKLNHEETEKQKYKNTFFVNNKDNLT